MLGQKINIDKSSVFFNQYADEETRTKLIEILGPMLDAQLKKYLGLPSLIRRSKKQVQRMLINIVAYI